MKLKVTVSWQAGKYTDYTKEFKDEQHYENWVNIIRKKGGKVIGTFNNNEE